MSLKLTRRKGSGTWYITGTIAGKRIRESTGTTDRKKASSKLSKRSAEIWERHIHGERQTVTVAEAMQVYINGREFSPSYVDALHKINDRLGQTLLSSIDQRAMDDYTATYYSKAKPATVLKSAITPITAIMTAGAKRGWCDVPKFDRPKQPRGRLRYLTEDEAERLVSECADHMKPLVEFLLNTGARLGEALDLQWHEVDLSRRMATFLDTKNGESRSVPLNVRAFTALATLSHRKGAVFRTNKGLPYARLGGSPIKTGFKSACRRAGISDCRVHDLRHTFASWLTMKGVPLRTIAELLGHKSIQMVMRYAHLSPDHLQSAVDVLDTELTQDAKPKMQVIERKGK